MHPLSEFRFKGLKNRRIWSIFQLMVDNNLKNDMNYFGIDFFSVFFVSSLFHPSKSRSSFFNIHLDVNLMQPHRMWMHSITILFCHFVRVHKKKFVIRYRLQYAQFKIKGRLVGIHIANAFRTFKHWPNCDYYFVLQSMHSSTRHPQSNESHGFLK